MFKSVLAIVSGVVVAISLVAILCFLGFSVWNIANALISGRYYLRSDNEMVMLQIGIMGVFMLIPSAFVLVFTLPPSFYGVRLRR